MEFGRSQVIDGGAPPNGTGGPADTLETNTSDYISPGGLAAVLLGFCVFFAITSLFIVSLRLWVRGRGKMLGLDDWLMLVGLVLFLVDTGLIAYATTQGLGTPNFLVPANMKMSGLKYVMIWQLFYVSSLACIKISICITLRRIAVERVHQWAIYVTIAISVVTALIGFFGDLLLCQPVEAQWAGQGKCAPRYVNVILNYIVSGGAIATDWACAIIPAWILWKTQMKKNVKISIGIVLGLGSLASLSTFARLPYIHYYDGDVDFLFKVAFVVIFSVVEGGIGLIAGSLPMLRLFFQRWLGTEVRSTNTIASIHIPVTQQGYSDRKPSVSSSFHRQYPRRGSRVRDDRDWERLDDVGVDPHHLRDVPEYSVYTHELDNMRRPDAVKTKPEWPQNHSNMI